LTLNSAFFTPVYPLPAVVVYKIYYDDGCCHLEQHRQDFCGQCILEH
jgi:hypothetical protein